MTSMCEYSGDYFLTINICLVLCRFDFNLVMFPSPPALEAGYWVSFPCVAAIETSRVSGDPSVGFLVPSIQAQKRGNA